MLESISGVRQDYHDTLVFAEWVITGIFTLEYILQIGRAHV